MEDNLGAYLGMQLVRDRVKRAISISQPEYLEYLREEFELTSTQVPLTLTVDKEREPESETTLALMLLVLGFIRPRWALSCGQLLVLVQKYNMLPMYTLATRIHP